MTTFYMMVGLPGSGKSYQAEILAENENALWLNSDDMRAVFGESKEDQSVNSEVFEYMKTVTTRTLKAGKNVVYDATNMSSRRRRVLLDQFRKIRCRKVCVMVLRRPEECKKAIAERDHIVPEYVVDKMHQRFETPYYFEGWDEIRMIFTDNDQDMFDPDEFVNSLTDYRQDNPWHLEKLGEHLVQTRSRLLKTKNRDLIIAGYLHDIGKPGTRFCDDAGIAHYYGHQAAGAYDVMFFRLGERDKLHVSWLISNHMKIHDWNKESEKVRKKYRNLYGDELFGELTALGEADEQSAIIDETAIRKKESKNDRI